MHLSNTKVFEHQSCRLIWSTKISWSLFVTSSKFGLSFGIWQTIDMINASSLFCRSAFRASFSWFLSLSGVYNIWNANFRSTQVSMIVMPNEYTSDFSTTGQTRFSGLIKIGVPPILIHVYTKCYLYHWNQGKTICPVTHFQSFTNYLNQLCIQCLLASPKSLILATHRDPISFNNIFSGLISRWIIFFFTIAVRPLATCMNISNTAVLENGLSSFSGMSHFSEMITSQFSPLICCRKWSYPMRMFSFWIDIWLWNSWATICWAWMVLRGELLVLSWPLWIHRSTGLYVTYFAMAGMPCQVHSYTVPCTK